MGPESAKSVPGQQLLDATQRPAARATQAIDDGRRGNGAVFGAFHPATGAGLTGTAQRRPTVTFVTGLEPAEDGIAPAIEPVDAILDNLSAQRATAVLLFTLAHPRWEVVFQPTYAADLNLIAPWWTIWRSLALKGRRFETGEEIGAAVEAVTASWNAHRHPFHWGRRRRHQPRRQPGIALVPAVA